MFRIIIGAMPGNVAFGVGLHYTRLLVVIAVMPALATSAGPGLNGQGYIVDVILVAWALTEVCRCAESSRSVDRMVDRVQRSGQKSRLMVCTETQLDGWGTIGRTPRLCLQPVTSLVMVMVAGTRITSRRTR